MSFHSGNTYPVTEPLMLTNWRLCLPSPSHMCTISYIAHGIRGHTEESVTATSQSPNKQHPVQRSVSREGPAHMGPQETLACDERPAARLPREAKPYHRPRSHGFRRWGSFPTRGVTGARRGPGLMPAPGPQGPLAQAGERAQGLSSWVLGLCHPPPPSLPSRAASQGTELDGCSGTPISLFL